MWKSGAERQQLTGRVSGMKPCREVKASTLKKRPTAWVGVLKPAAQQTYLSEKFMPNDVIQVRAIHRILGEHTGNELFGRKREGGREGVTGLSNTAVCLLQISGLEWRFAKEHGVPEQEDEGKMSLKR